MVVFVGRLRMLPLDFNLFFVVSLVKEGGV
jgi:hypothetical protein